MLARLMPEQRTAGISADGAPPKRPSQQRPFGHPPRPLRGTDLVKTEQHERPQIDQRKQAKGIGEGNHAGSPSGAFVKALAYFLMASLGGVLFGAGGGGRLANVAVDVMPPLTVCPSLITN